MQLSGQTLAQEAQPVQASGETIREKTITLAVDLAAQRENLHRTSDHAQLASLAAFGVDYDRPLNLCHRISFIFLQIYPPHIKIVIIFHSKYDIQENVLSFFHLILTA